MVKHTTWSWPGSAAMAAAARVAATAVVFALVGAFVWAWSLAPVSVMPSASAATLVSVFFRRQVGGGTVTLPLAFSLPLSVSRLAAGSRALPLVSVARVELQVVRALFGFEVRQEGRRGGVIRVSPWRRAAAVRAAARAWAVSARATAPAVIAEREKFS